MFFGLDVFPPPGPNLDDGSLILIPVQSFTITGADVRLPDLAATSIFLVHFPDDPVSPPQPLTQVGTTAGVIPTAIPEPTTALGLLGLVTSAFFRRRRRLLA